VLKNKRQSTLLIPRPLDLPGIQSLKQYIARRERTTGRSVFEPPSAKLQSSLPDSNCLTTINPSRAVPIFVFSSLALLQDIILGLQSIATMSLTQPGQAGQSPFPSKRCVRPLDNAHPSNPLIICWAYQLAIALFHLFQKVGRFRHSGHA